MSFLHLNVMLLFAVLSVFCTGNGQIIQFLIHSFDQHVDHVDHVNLAIKLISRFEKCVRPSSYILT